MNPQETINLVETGQNGLALIMRPLTTQHMKGHHPHQNYNMYRGRKQNESKNAGTS